MMNSYLHIDLDVSGPRRPNAESRSLQPPRPDPTSCYPLPRRPGAGYRRSIRVSQLPGTLQSRTSERPRFNPNPIARPSHQRLPSTGPIKTALENTSGPRPHVSTGAALIGFYRLSPAIQPSAFDRKSCGSSRTRPIGQKQVREPMRLFSDRACRFMAAGATPERRL